MILAAGCTTIHTQRRLELEQTAGEVYRLRDEIERLNERVSGIDALQQDLSRQFQEGRSSDREEIRRLQDRVAELERQLRDLDAKRSADRDQIIGQLSARIADLIRAQSKTTTPPARVERGYEHVVQPGETLSAIAAAYGVRPKAIIEANNLKNPNSLRVGQKLFIPAE